MRLHERRVHDVSSSSHCRVPRALCLPLLCAVGIFIAWQHLPQRSTLAVDEWFHRLRRSLVVQRNNVWGEMIRPSICWLDAPDNNAAELNDVPLAMDVFETRLEERRCVAYVTALSGSVSQRIDHLRVRATVPTLNIHNATPTAWNSKDDFESAHVSYFCEPTSSVVRASSSSAFRVDLEMGRKSCSVSVSPTILSSPSASGRIAMFTVFQPDAASGVAWIQSWLEHGVTHFYLFLNAGLDGAAVPDSMNHTDRTRIEDVVRAFPERITLVLWPFHWYSGSTESESSGGRSTQRHLASIAAYTTAVHRFGSSYSFMGA
jgi:hypothetical protein